MGKILGWCVFSALIAVLCAGDAPIVFPEDSNEDNTIFAGASTLDTDDLEYEEDDNDDQPSMIPRLIFPDASATSTDGSTPNYIRLPNRDGRFEVASRMSVLDSLRNASSFEAAKYVRFWYYSGTNAGLPVVLRLDQVQSLKLLHGFNESLPTKILIHGWLGSTESQVMAPLADEFMKRGNFNVFAVDWEDGAATLWYPTARYRVPRVAEVVAAMVNALIEFGQSPEQIGLVGHSLGAHIAGLTGKRIKQKVAFVIGLDPAWPLFRTKKPEDRLAANDALYVEVIHTNGNALGMYAKIGKADFYPNGGSVQPGCSWWDLTCHHERAVLYYKESLRAISLAQRCANVGSLYSKCTLGQAKLGGFESRKLRSKPRGVYFIQTDRSKPFLKSAQRVVAPLMPHHQ